MITNFIGKRPKTILEAEDCPQILRDMASITELYWTLIEIEAPEGEIKSTTWKNGPDRLILTVVTEIKKRYVLPDGRYE